jgi:two-component system sensor histidine kinase YesM
MTKTSFAPSNNIMALRRGNTRMNDNLKTPYNDMLLKRKFFRKNLLSILMPCLIPLLILGSLSIIISDQYIKQEAERNQENMLNQFNELIQIIASEVDSLSLSFDKEPKIAAKLKTILSKTGYSYEELETLFYLKNIIEVPANSKPYVHSIYVYYENEQGKFLSSREGLVHLPSFYDTSWYPNYNTQKNATEIVSEVREIKQFASENPSIKVVSLYKQLNMGGSVANNGVIVVNILPSYFEKYYGAISEVPDRSFYITDEDNQIIMQSEVSEHTAILTSLKHTDSSDIVQMNEGKLHIAAKKTNRLGWNLISVIPKQSLDRLPLTLIATIGVLSLVSIIICTIVAIWLTRKNYRQVQGIIDILDAADAADPTEKAPEQIQDIYELIIKNIVESFVEQKYLKVQLSERKYKMQALEFKALQSQINPHFLYNTLNSIYWKSFQLSNSPNVACHMIELLSEILQYSLDTSTETVTLGEEISHIRSYVEIQQMRYKDRFEVIWDGVEVVEDCEALKFSLQPLIENCIQYGIEARSFLRIKVKFRMKDSILKVTIIDNGPGVEAERLSLLRSSLEPDNELHGHLGLSNTNKRLVLRYGESCKIKLLSKKGSSTAVTVLFPQSQNGTVTGN